MSRAWLPLRSLARNVPCRVCHWPFRGLKREVSAGHPDTTLTRGLALSVGWMQRRKPQPAELASSPAICALPAPHQPARGENFTISRFVEHPVCSVLANLEEVVVSAEQPKSLKAKTLDGLPGLRLAWSHSNSNSSLNTDNNNQLTLRHLPTKRRTYQPANHLPNQPTKPHPPKAWRKIVTSWDPNLSVRSIHSSKPAVGTVCVCVYMCRQRTT